MEGIQDSKPDPTHFKRPETPLVLEQQGEQGYDDATEESIKLF